MTNATIVLDMGKSVSKVSCWAEDGTLIDRRTRSNVRIGSSEYDALDAANNEAWLVDTLGALAQKVCVRAIIPVSHGAAAGILQRGALAAPPFDYETPIPRTTREQYDRLRDPFALSGSPALPDGLNLGAQFFYLHGLHPELFSARSTLVPWAQYWSWLLSGVAASEVTSLGCHTDLWRPLQHAPSGLSVSQGWAERIGPLRHAGDVLGTLRPAWAASTGLSTDILVHCGLHDSNAALLAARAYPQLSMRDFTVLSTGTWFIGMRSVQSPEATDLESLEESRDCLVNVDVHGVPVPSARFMGGREIERLTAPLHRRIDEPALQLPLLSAAHRVLSSQTFVLPTFAPGTGPYGSMSGQWLERPDDIEEQLAAVCLYAALVADALLRLIGAKNAVLIEGRFSACELLVRALASLRPTTRIYVTSKLSDASFGALRLLYPALTSPTELREVMPLLDDVSGYRERWQQRTVGNGPRPD